ncbi:DUF6350 family protein [Bifidobacterium simiiventris]|uniref:cell division protein PerM n=1 Tax=Bifidobacterium simiiventris TaxID=2834434 RepID=UPI001C59818D|nr:DUF6350 family protein [Bifidobacterium simiiventris]MBW3079336.1 hypothetical protein [Bifidobacterium simiiventris]
MISRIKPLLRGIAVAAASMAVFAIAIGCFTALMLLVISMEEGGDNLSAYALSLSAAVVLLSQGVGFVIAPVNLTLVPLLLTLLLIALVRAFAQRLTCSVPGYVTGLVSWMTFDALFSRGTDAVLDDALWLILVKGAVIFTIGYLCAAVPVASLTASIIERMRAVVAPRLRQAITMGLSIGLVLVLLYLVVGVTAVALWSARNHAAVVRLYELLGMGTGSRILTTIACLAWLPNLCIWAVSWVFGAGFSIGDIGSFSLWVGQSTSLPPIPVFGVLPEPVAAANLRFVLVSIPLACGFAAGLFAMWSKRGFGVRFVDMDEPDGIRRAIMDFAYPVGAFCIAGALISVGYSLIFVISNGGLGNERLASLGVDVVRSTQAVARPTALGLLAAWLVTLIGVTSVFGMRWAARSIRSRAAAGRDADGSQSPQTSN